MPVTLADYVNAIGEDAVALAAQCVAEATALVNRHIGATTAASNPHGVPQTVIDRAVLEVGADLFYRKAARNGVVNFGNGMEGAAVLRINRDPMSQAYAILGPYLPMGFA
ncbi:hypothetical protein [Microbacterium sp. KNMS]